MPMFKALWKLVMIFFVVVSVWPTCASAQDWEALAKRAGEVEKMLAVLECITCGEYPCEDKADGTTLEICNGVELNCLRIIEIGELNNSTKVFQCWVLAKIDELKQRTDNLIRLYDPNREYFSRDDTKGCNESEEKLLKLLNDDYFKQICEWLYGQGKVCPEYKSIEKQKDQCENRLGRRNVL